MKNVSDGNMSGDCGSCATICLTDNVNKNKSH